MFDSFIEKFASIVGVDPFRKAKVKYRKGSIGLESRIPRDVERAKHRAFCKRQFRKAKRLETWTGVRD